MKTRILIELKNGQVWGYETDEVIQITKGDGICFGDPPNKLVTLLVKQKVANFYKGTYDIHCSIQNQFGTLEESGLCQIA